MQACEKLRPIKIESPTAIQWDFPSPCVVGARVRPEDIDSLGHTSNASYVKWLELAHWAHNGDLGLNFDVHKKLNTAMVVYHHDLKYLAPSLLRDSLKIATWVSSCDNKLRFSRYFQIAREADGKTLFRGRTVFVCTDMSFGKPKRLPALFREVFQTTALENNHVIAVSSPIGR